MLLKESALMRGVLAKDCLNCECGMGFSVGAVSLEQIE